MNTDKREGVKPWSELTPPEKTESSYDPNVVNSSEKSNLKNLQSLDSFSEERLVLVSSQYGISIQKLRQAVYETMLEGLKCQNSANMDHIKKGLPS